MRLPSLRARERESLREWFCGAVVVIVVGVAAAFTWAFFR